MDLVQNVLTGIAVVDDQKLTSSQRNRCLTLFALQDDPFGMISQWLYSRALERENAHAQIIEGQKRTILEENQYNQMLLLEMSKLAHAFDLQQQQIEQLESVVVHELMGLKLGMPIDDSNIDLIQEINQLVNNNKVLMQSLEKAVADILQLIAKNN